MIAQPTRELVWETDELEYGLFYVISTQPAFDHEPSSDDLSDFERKYVQRSNDLTTSGDDIEILDYSWCETVSYDSEAIETCGVCQKKQLRERIADLRIEFVNDNQLSPLPICGDNPFLLMASEYLKMLESTTIAGLVADKVTMSTQNDRTPDQSRVRIIQFVGQNAQAHWIIMDSASRMCPNCSKVAIVCECGQIHRVCPSCHQVNVAGPWDDKEIQSRALYSFAKQPPTRQPVIDPRLWDGSDFVAPEYVTRRVVDWLLATNAFPFLAAPVPVLDVLSREEMQQLRERVSRPL